MFVVKNRAVKVSGGIVYSGAYYWVKVIMMVYSMDELKIIIEPKAEKFTFVFC